MPLFDDPLIPPAPALLPSNAEHMARCDYLSAVQAAQQHCEAMITAARTEYLQAEHRAWAAYSAASDLAVRAYFGPPADGTSRWFVPEPASHPYPPKG